MSTTPAAQIARLKATYPLWCFTRTTTGELLAVRRATGQRISAASIVDMEARLRDEGARKKERRV
jgi:hypothetical protein